MDSSLGNITPRIGHGRQNADLSLPFCSYKLTPTQRVIFHRSLSHCAERYPCLYCMVGLLKCGLKSANGRNVTKRAIGLINVDYIVSGRNYDILDPIIAQMLTSRPDLCRSADCLAKRARLSLSTLCVGISRGSRWCAPRANRLRVGAQCTTGGLCIFNQHAPNGVLCAMHIVG